MEVVADSRCEEQRHLGRCRTNPSASPSPLTSRHLSIPLVCLPAPEDVVLAEGGNILLNNQRPRSNSLPWSTISSDPMAQLLDIRNATITPSPLAEDSISLTALPQIATIAGDRLLEDLGVDVSCQRTVSRASIQSLKRYSNSRRVRFGGKKRGKYAQIIFQYSIYLLLSCIIYFVLVGIPLWKGVVWWLWYSTTFSFHGPGSLTGLNQVGNEVQTRRKGRMCYIHRHRVFVSTQLKDHCCGLRY